MSPRWKRYKRNFEHSYAFGVFPTLVRTSGTSNEGIGKIRQISRQLGIPCELDDRKVERLGARPNDYAVGIFAKGTEPLDDAADQIVLVRPSGMGNLGTIIRTMIGFGLHDLAIVEPAADPFDPQTVRASMGALFRMRLGLFPDFGSVFRSGARTFYPLMTDGERQFGEVALATPCSLVFGNEGEGLEESFRQVGTTLRIPQSNEVDSLNLALAVGIGVYELARARRGGSTASA
jgi:TrmH family RNA methyltransferase